jgi:hypothetical protein
VIELLLVLGGLLILGLLTCAVLLAWLTWPVPRHDHAGGVHRAPTDRATR